MRVSEGDIHAALKKEQNHICFSFRTQAQNIRWSEFTNGQQYDHQ